MSVVAVVFGIVVASAFVVQFPGSFAWVVLLPLVVLSGSLHAPRWHALVLGLSVASLILTAVSTGRGQTDTAAAIVATVGVGLITLWRAIVRDRAGVQGPRGEALLLDLRARLLDHGRVPPLPAPWHVETCVQSAFGHRFSGDFVVTRRTRDERYLEMVLVDISGKGMDAGGRSLALSGGLDALLGSVGQDEFLSLANEYVGRQEWSEGFATAIYLVLDLHTREFTLSSAGHPPAAWYRADVDSWRVMDAASGPVLGLVPGVTYRSHRGRLAPGDALLLYTDGMIEDRAADLDNGIDRMLSVVSHAERQGFRGVAPWLCAHAPAGEGDDRGVVVVWSD